MNDCDRMITHEGDSIRVDGGYDYPCRMLESLDEAVRDIGAYITLWSATTGRNFNKEKWSFEDGPPPEWFIKWADFKKVTDGILLSD